MSARRMLAVAYAAFVLACLPTAARAAGPSVTWVAPQPAPSAPVKGTVPLEVTATPDPNATDVNMQKVTIAKVEFKFFAAGSLVRTEQASQSTTSDNWHFDWHSSNVADGPTDLKAVATDSANTPIFGPVLSVVVDNNKPTATITSGPNGGTFGPTTPLTWTFQATDGRGSDVQVKCGIDNTSPPPCVSQSTFTASNLPNGHHKFTLIVTDDAENSSPPADAPFDIDATPPASTIISGPTKVINSPAFFEFASSEAASTFQCRVFPAGSAPTPWRDCSGASSEVVKEPAGDYVFQVRATDRYGNVEPKPSQRLLTVENAPGQGVTAQGKGTTTGTARPAKGGRRVKVVRTTFAYGSDKSRTWFTSFRLAKVPRGAIVRITCRGKGCPHRAVRLKGKGKPMPVKALVGPHFGRGTVIRIVEKRRGKLLGVAKVTILGPGHIGGPNVQAAPTQPPPR